VITVWAGGHSWPVARLGGWTWQHPEVEHVISHRNAGATRRLLETVAAIGAER
jgi:hypothetical protein